MSNMNVIQHNIQAMFGERQLGITTKKKAKSTEKLSSGFKINRAADDASGLAISEKMRKRIRGLNQGTENMQDGISLCQIADGGLDEVDSILHRITELTIKAANGTLSDSDRSDVQHEINALNTEIDRISETTTFNEHIHPLKGGIKSRIPLTFQNFTLEQFSYINMEKWPFREGDSAKTMRLRAVMDGTGTEHDGDSYPLIYGDGSTNMSSVIFGVRTLDGNGDEIITPHKVSYSQMSVKPGSVALDEANQRLSRILTYQDPGDSSISIEIKQSVQLDATNKRYKIDTSLSNSGSADISEYMFMHNFDTAYGGNIHGDHVEEYYSDGNRIDESTVWVNGDCDNRFNIRISNTKRVFGDTTEGDVIEQIFLKERTDERHDGGKGKYDDIPTSLSIANTEEASLPFSEFISVAGNRDQAFLAVGPYGTDHWDLFENYSNSSRSNLVGADISFTYAVFGDSTMFYGIRDINNDSNIGTSKQIPTKYLEATGKELIRIQSSDTASDGIEIPLVDATAKGLGLYRVDVSTQESAVASIGCTDKALKKVSEYRSNFGAHQNRLEHSIKNNQNTAENTTAAESRIRDTDMAKEIVNSSNGEIIQQAGQSMLAQANQSRQRIMTLLG